MFDMQKNMFEIQLDYYSIIVDSPTKGIAFSDIVSRESSDLVANIFPSFIPLVYFATSILRAIFTSYFYALINLREIKVLLEI
jgi:hypothetical protein